jgi:hypothetical protein
VGKERRGQHRNAKKSPDVHGLVPPCRQFTLTAVMKEPVQPLPRGRASDV